ncbi:MarR family winged helix-turn-helix transcriptional regulator [Salsuginibacillus halophilus]|uniref:MarR family winged helix-turn-helix transcriptional regulator n=1 Tax=Salsuginibacillus halophilus TaxID=517424 RepID=UPI001FEC8A22|nr:MarR family transcriptional regulator [Salsuginibacillus halophilus]
MNLRLEDYISIFIHETDLTLTSEIKKKLEPHNLAPEQNLVMMVLWESDGWTQNEIAARLNKDKTNVARMAANLADKGFLTRVPRTEDRRSLQLFLTEKGRELGEEVVPLAERFHNQVVSGITEEEQAVVRQVLQRMQRNVQ